MHDRSSIIVSMNKLMCLACTALFITRRPGDWLATRTPGHPKELLSTIREDATTRARDHATQLALPLDPLVRTNEGRPGPLIPPVVGPMSAESNRA